MPCLGEAGPGFPGLGSPAMMPEVGSASQKVPHSQSRPPMSSVGDPRGGGGGGQGPDQRLKFLHLQAQLQVGLPRPRSTLRNRDNRPVHGEYGHSWSRANELALRQRALQLPSKGQREIDATLPAGPSRRASVCICSQTAILPGGYAPAASVIRHLHIRSWISETVLSTSRAMSDSAAADSQPPLPPPPAPPLPPSRLGQLQKIIAPWGLHRGARSQAGHEESLRDRQIGGIHGYRQ